VTVSLTIYVEDPAAKLLSFTTIRLYRDSSPTGTFATLAASAALVSGQTQYSFSDSGGTVDSWYRFQFYNATGPVVSDFGPAFQPTSFTLRTLRLAAARMAGSAFSGTCSSDGSSTSLVAKHLLNSGKDAHFHEGDWLYRPDASASGDKVRRIIESGFNTSTGAFSIPTGDAWSVLPATDEVYQVFGLFPPIAIDGESTCWDELIRQALRRLWVRDQIELGVGTTTGKTRYSVSAVAPYAHKLRVRQVWLRTFDDNDFPTDQLFGRVGTWWRMVDNAADGLFLDLSYAPATTEHVIIEVDRNYPALYADTDVVAGTDGAFDLATAAVARQALIASKQMGSQRWADVDGQYRELAATYGARSGGVLQ